MARTVVGDVGNVGTGGLREARVEIGLGSVENPADARLAIGPDDVIRAGAALAVLGFATKAGLAPTHSWLPDAHSQAPATVSGLMSGVLLSVAFYAILRVQAITDAALGPELMRVLLTTAGLGVAGLAYAVAEAHRYTLRRVTAPVLLSMLARQADWRGHGVQATGSSRDSPALASSPMRARNSVPMSAL